MTYYSTAVYCVSDGEAVKIGYSSEINSRFLSFTTSTWRDVKPCWAWWGDKTHEDALKALLADRCIRNEWFWDGDDFVKSLLPHNLPENGHGWPVKVLLQKSLRKKGLREMPFPGIRGMLSTTHERMFRTFNAYHQAAIIDLAAKAGVALTDVDFATRDGREIEAVLSQVSA